MKPALQKADSVPARVELVLGTTPRQVKAGQRAISSVLDAAQSSDQVAGCILFDALRYLGGDTSMVSDSERDTCELFSPEEFITARFPVDRQSLARLESQGAFAILPADWPDRLRAALDNLGATGDPRIGYTLAVLLQGPVLARFRQLTGKLLGHQGPRNHLWQVGPDSCRLVTELDCTAAGGMSNGAVRRFLGLVKAEARCYGVETKVILNVLLQGDLEVVDKKRTRLNEIDLLRYLRALASGQYVDPLTGRLVHCPFDQLFLQSNRNCNGRFLSLPQLVTHEAWRKHILWHSPLAGYILERLVDIENWQFDEYGDPLVGYTMGVARLSFDTGKLLDYVVDRAACMLARSLQESPPDDQARQEALLLARSHGVVESSGDHQLTGRILGAGKELSTQVRASLRDRTRAFRGTRRLRLLIESINAIETTELPSVYVPSMIERAKEQLDKVTQALDSYQQQRLKNPLSSGVLGVAAVLGYYRQLVEGSRRAVMEKIGQLQQAMEPHQELVNTAIAQTRRLEELSPPAKMINLFMPARLARCLQESGSSVLENQLQVQACQVTISQLLEPLSEHLGERLKTYRLFEQALGHIHASAGQRAARLESRPAASETALGFELVDAEYMTAKFEDLLQQLGGRQRLIEMLIAALLEKYGSLAGLLGKSTDQVELILKQVCREFFRPLATNSDIVVEFNRLFAHKAQQVGLLRKLILQAEGRLRTAGEAGREITWLRFVTVPQRQYQDWISSLLSEAGPAGGKWQVVVDGNQDAVTIVQIRGQVSLSALIEARQADQADQLEQWKQDTSRCVDMGVALMVPLNPTDRQLRRVLAKGIITGQLVYETSKGFGLKKTDGQCLWLGLDASAAEDKLKRWWPQLAWIESTFTHRVVVDDKGLHEQVEQLGEQLRQDQKENRLLELIDEQALADIKEQLALLRDWACRLRPFARTGKRLL